MSRDSRTERRRLGRGRTWPAAVGLVPSSGSLTGLVTAVSRHRGRPVEILDRTLPRNDLSGLWIPQPEVDYIICAQGMAAGHKRVVVCHELAHMLLGHSPREGHLDAAVFAPDVGAGLASRFLCRQGYGNRDEADAESLATVLATTLAARVAAAQSIATREADNISARLR